MESSSAARAANIIAFSGCKRLYERLDAGLQVWCGGQELYVANWSLGGLGIITTDAQWQPGSNHKLTVRLPLPGGQHYDLPATVQVVHSHDNGYKGLRFTRMTSNHQQVLQYALSCHKQQTAPTLDGVLAASRQTGSDGPMPLHRRIMTLLGVAIVAFIALYTLASAINRALFLIPAPYAVVTAPGYTLTSPADGIINLQHAGSSIAEGVTLATLREAELDKNLAVLRAELQLQDDKITILEQHLASQEQLFQHYAIIAAEESTGSTRQRSALQRDVGSQRTQHQRLKDLYEQGLTSKTAVENAARALASAEARLADASAKAAIAATNQELAENRYFYTGSRIEGGTPHDIARDLALAKAERANKAAQLTILEQQQDNYHIVSPCDCTIDELLVSPHTWVKAGTPVASLHLAAPASRTIEVKLPQEQVADLAPGTQASVMIPGLAEEVPATVASLHRASHGHQVFGWSGVLVDKGDYATVRLATTEPLPETAHPGLPVQVTLQAPANALGRFLQQQLP